MDTKTEDQRQVEEFLEQFRSGVASNYNKEKAQPNEAKYISQRVLKALENNEEGDGKCLVEELKGTLCFNHFEHCWYRFNGSYWEKDLDDVAFASVGKIAELYKADAKNHSEDIRKKILKRVNSLQTEPRRKRVLRFAAAGIDNSLGITGDEWDLDPWLLGCKNGVVDLKTGQFRKGQPQDYLRLVSQVEWKGIDTQAPRWEKFISEIFDKDEEVISYMQRLLGYSISGSTEKHILPVLCGKGRNGKSVLMEAVSYAVGPLAISFQTDLILKQKWSKSSSAASPEIVALKGVRLAWCSE